MFGFKGNKTQKKDVGKNKLSFENISKTLNEENINIYSWKWNLKVDISFQKTVKDVKFYFY